MTDHPEPVIDPATFNELCENTGADFVRELVATFLEEAPGLLAEMDAAQPLAVADRFRRAAHSLKSNAQTFGATRLWRLARELEHSGASSGAVDLAQLGAAFDEAALALGALCRE